MQEHAVKSYGVSYNKFIAALKKEKIEIDRKILSDIAAKDSETFKKIVLATGVIKEAGFSFTTTEK